MAKYQNFNLALDELEKIKIPGKTLDKYIKEYLEVLEENITPEKRLVVNPKYWITFKFLEEEGIDDASFRSEFEKTLKKLIDNDELDMIEVIATVLEELNNSKGNEF